MDKDAQRYRQVVAALHLQLKERQGRVIGQTLPIFLGGRVTAHWIMWRDGSTSLDFPFLAHFS